MRHTVTYWRAASRVARASVRGETEVVGRRGCGCTDRGRMAVVVVVAGFDSAADAALGAPAVSVCTSGRSLIGCFDDTGTEEPRAR